MKFGEREQQIDLYKYNIDEQTGQCGPAGMFDFPFKYFKKLINDITASSILSICKHYSIVSFVNKSLKVIF
jgi:hypothetical protein